MRIIVIYKGEFLLILIIEYDGYFLFIFILLIMGIFYFLNIFICGNIENDFILKDFNAKLFPIVL